MTVQDTPNFISYVGNDAQTVFNFVFRVDDVSWLSVDFTDNFDQFNLNVDQDLNPGGNATYTVAPPSPGMGGPDAFTITRATPQTQEQDYTRYDPFDSESTEDNLDKIVMMIQDLESLLANLVAFGTLEGSILRWDTSLAIDGWNEFGPGVNEFLLPLQDGAPGQVMVTDGLGQLNWTTITPGAVFAGTTVNSTLRWTGANWAEFLGYLFPLADGVAGQALVTDGLGQLSFGGSNILYAPDLVTPRVVGENFGTASIRANGATDTERTALTLNRNSSSVKAEVGFLSTKDLRVHSLVDDSNFILQLRSAASADLIQYQINPSVVGFLDTPTHQFNVQGAPRFYIHTFNVPDFGTTASLIDASGTRRPVGFNISPVVNNNGSFTVDQTAASRTYLNDGNGVLTVTLPNDADIPSGQVAAFIARTVADGYIFAPVAGVTLLFWDGSTYQSITNPAVATSAGEGRFFLTKGRTDTEWVLDGNGLS